MDMKSREPPDMRVSAPETRGSGPTAYVVYKVQGRDYDGIFEVFRRFSEFMHFREFLVNRWPGLYIPPMPSKKTVGKTDINLTEERTYFLDRFLKEIATLPYIYEGSEIQLFVRD